MAGAFQVLAGFNGTPSVFQLLCLTFVVFLGGLVGWWSAVPAQIQKKTLSTSYPDSAEHYLCVTGC